MVSRFGKNLRVTQTALFSRIKGRIFLSMSLSFFGSGTSLKGTSSLTCSVDLAGCNFTRGTIVSNSKPTPEKNCTVLFSK